MYCLNNTRVGFMRCCPALHIHKRLGRKYFNVVTLVIFSYFMLVLLFFYNEGRRAGSSNTRIRAHEPQSPEYENVVNNQPTRQIQTPESEHYEHSMDNTSENTAGYAQVNDQVEQIATRIIQEYRRFQKDDQVGMVQAVSDRGCKEYKRAADMQRLVIPDILGHAQHIEEDAAMVSLIAHLTEDRLPRLQRLIKQWNGPLSISLYLDIVNTRNIIKTILETEGLSVRDNILLHIIPAHGVIYPVNYLRNVAINNTCTRYIFLMDIDFVPVAASHNMLLEDLEYARAESKQKRRVYVVPAFEEKGAKEYDFPLRKGDDLMPLWDSGIIVPFHLEKFPPGHHRTDFQRWRNAESPYTIEWEPLFEPYVVGERLALPLYSEAFVGRGMNKIQQIVEMVAMGFEFWVHPDAFIVHIQHEKNRSTVKQDQFATCSNSVMKEFNEYIFKKYGFRG